MDVYSCGEELVIKARKPYTITKQRERWTEEEHDRFLEAIKLYGRAWRRIEEHIRTKTAVQIRSHAQKFFSKFEKEAHVKGGPKGQALEIDIPPPRPKRKLNNPYPRKTSVGSPTLNDKGKDGNLVTPTASLQSKLLLDLDKEPLPEGPIEKERRTNEKEDKTDSFSEVFTQQSEEAYCSSVSSVNTNPRPTRAIFGTSGAFVEFVPSVKEATVNDEVIESKNLIIVDAKELLQDNNMNKVPKFEKSNASPDNLHEDETKDNSHCLMQRNDMQANLNFPGHIPVHVLEGSLEACTQNNSQGSMFHPKGEVQGHHNNLPNSSFHHSILAFQHAFTPLCHNQEDNREDNRSLLHMPASFSNLILSTLQQNPASHSAATFAATSWPFGNGETRNMNSTPSTADIAAATVAAATAWWATHGMLPFCAPPFHTAFTCSPAFSSPAPQKDTNPESEAKTFRVESSLQNAALKDEESDLEHSESLQAQHLNPSLSNFRSKPGDLEKVTAVTEPYDSNRVNSRKLVGHSSCASNTPSKMNHSSGTDSSNCFSRSAYVNSTSDSWKAVSEEGRLAFQALFSKEVLPQSFSPPDDGEDKLTTSKKEGELSLLDLHSKASTSNQGFRKGDKNGQEGLSTIGAEPRKLDIFHRTGFKPYKRCSVEAKENRVANPSGHSEVKGPKRICLGAEASSI